MTTTALQERIAKALAEHWRRKHSTLLTSGPCSGCSRVAADAVAAEVQAAQAEGWDEGYLDRSPYGGRARSRADNPYHTTEKESKHDD